MSNRPKLYPHQDKALRMLFSALDSISVSWSLEEEFQSRNRLQRHRGKPRYYECDGCGSWHAADWNGDCRDDAHRYAYDEIDAKHGAYGWIAVDQSEVL